MTVLQLPTRSARQWAGAVEALEDALLAADHPRLHEHAAHAAVTLAEAGSPTNVWANRIAAIAVIASRRADTAPTMERRSAYFGVAAAASELLLLAELVHAARPDPAASRVLAELHAPDRLDRSALI